MNKEAVLVTGGAGYIGSHVCKGLASAGFLPVVLDDLSMGHEWAVKWGPFVNAGLDDEAAVKGILAQYSPVGTIHLAAKAYVGESVKYPDDYFNNNVRQLIALLDVLRGSTVKAFVFSSSCSVYGTPKSMPVTEDMPLDPISPYAQTKLTGEWAIKAYSEAFGFNYALLRYFNASGADPDLEIGEDHDPETHLIPNAIKAALSGAPLKVFGTDYDTPDGTCIRDYVHVSDLATAHVLALKKALAGTNVIANMGSGVGNSVLDVAKTVERVSGRKVNLELCPRRAGDATALFASFERAKSELGWTPKYQDIETIVKTAWDWTIANESKLSFLS